jgi:RNA polymerase-associated protein CTR9
VEAYVGLAILDLNSEKPDRVMTAMNYLKKAYQLDPNNSMVLNHLANHFFYKNDLEKVQQLASNAFHHSKVPEIQGESLYYLGRLNHHQQLFDQAFEYYTRLSSQYWPEFPLGHFSLGQMYIQRDDIDQAISQFSKVAASFPENFETQKVFYFL